MFHGYFSLVIIIIFIYNIYNIYFHVVIYVGSNMNNLHTVKWFQVTVPI